MPALGRFVFHGKSGKSYPFKVYPLGTRIRKFSGVYVIASRVPGRNGGHRLVAVYVGHTEDLSQPFDRHHKAEELKQRGANCIFLQSDDSEDSRQAKQYDLVTGLQPLCND